jgi:hypothetical protein
MKRRHFLVLLCTAAAPPLAAATAVEVEVHYDPG